jgi:hypothetical protein
MLSILGQHWLEETRGWSEAGWVDIAATPVDAARAVAYVDPADGIVPGLDDQPRPFSRVSSARSRSGGRGAPTSSARTARS